MKALQVFVYRMQTATKNKGFSLIELLVVMFIIGILTSVLLPNLMSARQKAKDAQKISDVNAIKDALRLYYNDTQVYPASKAAALAVLPTYMPAAVDVGFTYYSPSPGFDSFKITFGLESKAGDEDESSQQKCGISPTVDGVFAVCAN